MTLTEKGGRVAKSEFDTINISNRAVFFFFNGLII